ncbi:MAG: GlcNAc-PI de-N-acetylase [Acidimicrobiales bacterium]|nr:MAG: GlcNAc-PI de-N-acetylase [Acidimicrobiales bacterium]
MGLGTLVCFHAHPDDEAIATGGTMARAHAEGRRVVLVFATRGERGEVPEGMLAPGEQLGLRRLQEAWEAAAILGVDRIELLGWVDSGMAGSPTNSDPWSFANADVRHAARRLAVILEEEMELAGGEVAFTIYDSEGGYGHPDHVMVHRVGVLAAELAGVERVFEAVMNRDHLRRLVEAAPPEWRAAGTPDPSRLPGLAESEITHAVDVRPWLADKRRAMEAHASQITPDSLFLSLPEEAFEAAFGTEWFVRRPRPARRTSGMETWLF